MNAIEQLRKCMKTFPQGVVTNRTYVEQLLADCWDELQSDDGGMKANKLVGRTKDLTWAPVPHVYSVLVVNKGLTNSLDILPSHVDPTSFEVCWRVKWA